MLIFRNANLEAEAAKVGYSFPSARKTGTTICGLVFKVSVYQIPLDGKWRRLKLTVCACVCAYVCGSCEGRRGARS